MSEQRGVLLTVDSAGCSHASANTMCGSTTSKTTQHTLGPVLNTHISRGASCAHPKHCSCDSHDPPVATLNTMRHHTQHSTAQTSGSSRLLPAAPLLPQESGGKPLFKELPGPRNQATCSSRPQAPHTHNPTHTHSYTIHTQLQRDPLLLTVAHPS